MSLKIFPPPAFRVSHQPKRSSYDYIVVGAGTAGCVLANRLSEDPNVHVLLIEAGPADTSMLIRIPAGISRLHSGSSYNWGFETVPQRHMSDRRMFLPQGRGLGGGSSINGMIYMRGQAADYDRWRDLGNEGWGYDDLLPYFIKSEGNRAFGGPYHGTDGPLTVSDLPYKNSLTDAFISAGLELGLDYRDDHNGAVQGGVGPFQVTVDNAERKSAAGAFLHPIRQRKNLDVVVEATVTRLTIEKGVVRGVEIAAVDGLLKVAASSEVVVSSGAINSPKILLQSGIGPADELSSVGVAPAHNLQGVGKNLQDHLDIGVLARAAVDSTYDGEDRLHRAARHGLQYLLFGTGMASSVVCEAAAFLQSGPDVESPDIQMHFLPVYVKDHGRKPVAGNGVTFHNCNLRPKSRGEVTLRSADPAERPLIDPNYLSEPDDFAPLRAAIEWTRRFVSTKSLSPYLHDVLEPAVSVKSRKDIDNYIRAAAETDYHPVGTCKMGRDDMAVVDNQLRVHGLGGLRVVDSSVMPTIVSGNTNAASVMIGEKGSDLILHSQSATALRAVQ